MNIRLSSDGHASAIFLVKINQAFLSSPHHIASLYGLLQVNGQKLHRIRSPINFVTISITKVCDKGFKMTEARSIKLNLISFMDNISLTDSRCLTVCVIGYYLSYKFVFWNLASRSEKLLILCWSMIVKSCGQFSLSNLPHLIDQVLLDSFKLFRTF